MPSIPDTEIRFTSRYAWLLIGFGVMFGILGFMMMPRSVGLGALIVVLSIAGIIGGNYWRQHLPVIIRMTPRQLHLPGGMVVDWNNIAEVANKKVPFRQRTEFVCIKLKKRPAAQSRRDTLNSGFARALRGGFDILVSNQEMSMRFTAEAVVEEIRRRVAAATA